MKNIVQVIFAIAMALLALLILKVERSARDERRAFQPCAVDAKGGVTCPAEEGTRARRRP